MVYTELNERERAQLRVGDQIYVIVQNLHYRDQTMRMRTITGFETSGSTTNILTTYRERIWGEMSQTICPNIAIFVKETKRQWWEGDVISKDGRHVGRIGYGHVSLR